MLATHLSVRAAVSIAVVGMASSVFVMGCKHDGSGTGTSVSASTAAPALPLPTKPLAAGDAVNDFVAMAHTGEKVRLSRYLKKPVLVYFCANDAAPLCVELAGSFRDRWLRLNSQLSMVFGVASGDRLARSAFAADQHLPFLLLSDDGDAVSKAFGIAPESAVAYLLGADRKVLRAFALTAGVDVPSQVLTALRELGLTSPEYPR